MSPQEGLAPEDEGARYRELVSRAFSHLEKGEQLGPPADRAKDPLEAVVLGVIGALRAETRLYPEAYAWIVADAVRDALLGEEVGEARTSAALEALEAAQASAEGIPALYPRSRLLTLLKGVWEAGWRPVHRPTAPQETEQRPEETK